MPSVMKSYDDLYMRDDLGDTGLSRHRAQALKPRLNAIQLPPSNTIMKYNYYSSP